MSALWIAVSGMLFGFGLAYSEMIDRQRVLGFLDPVGGWDPTLLFVMMGAVGVTLIGFLLVRRMKQPVLAASFDWPKKKMIDGKLLLGAALFGIGWGLAGYCPGPGIAVLGFAGWNSLLFVSGMVGGIIIIKKMRV